MTYEQGELIIFLLKISVFTIIFDFIIDKSSYLFGGVK